MYLTKNIKRFPISCKNRQLLERIFFLNSYNFAPSFTSFLFVLICAFVLENTRINFLQNKYLLYMIPPYVEKLWQENGIRLPRIKIFPELIYIHRHVFLIYYVLKNFPKEGEEILYKGYKLGARQMFREIKKTTNLSAISFFGLGKRILETSGFGKLKFVTNLEEKKSVVIVDNPVFVKDSLKLIGPKAKREEMCVIVRGTLAGFFTEYFGEDADCTEEKCFSSTEE